MSHIVVSLVNEHRGGVGLLFTVDYISGDPDKTLAQWRRRHSVKLPVAAFAIADSDVPTFLQKADVVLGGAARFHRDDFQWIRNCPLDSEWRPAVVRYAAQFEGAAQLLAGLL